MSTVKYDQHFALIQGVVDMALAYPIKWPNASFNTPSDSPWLRASIIANQPVQTALGSNGKNRIGGFMQLDVFTPKASGWSKAIKIADEIETNMKSGTTLTSNGIDVRIESVGIRQGTDDSVWHHKIVQVDFYSQYSRGL